jgi:hypothetical protein
VKADTNWRADEVRVVDSTPVECWRSRETARGSDRAGWAEYGYCASHFRCFGELRLHRVCTLAGLPVGFALTGANVDERQVLPDIMVGPVRRPGLGRSSSGTRTITATTSRPL